MTEIENVPGPVPGPVQNILDTALDFRQGRKQDHGVEVALYGDVEPDPRPRFIELDVPIQPQDVAAGTAHERQERRRSRSEIDDRNPFRFQTIDNRLNVRQDVFAIVSRRQTPHPTVENLNDLDARPDLVLQIRHDHVRKFAEQRMPLVGPAEHHLFGIEIVP